MFLFLLICAEFAFLYAVFWYLYLREPIQARRIEANTWGSYSKQAEKTNITENYSLQHSKEYHSNSVHTQKIKSFMLPTSNIMTFDLKTNKFVPLETKSKSFLANLFERFDLHFSEFNVKP